MDFGFNKGDNSNNNAAPIANNTGGDSTDLGTGNLNNSANGESADDINATSTSTAAVGDKSGNQNNADTSAGTAFDNGDNTDNKGGDDDKPKGSDEAEPLVEGTTLDVDGVQYVVDANGNVVDANGVVFKEAKDVDSWMKELGTVEGDDTSLSIDTIQTLVGVDIVDDNDQPVVFENTPAGVKAYIEAVNEANRDDNYEQAVNTLYQKYPIIPDVINYYLANGNSLEGFNEVPDRSTITIDDANEAQHESIIRTSWKEQNRKGDVEGYIAYLKTSGTLLATAQEELTALQEADAEYKESIALKAQEAETARIEKLEKYWGEVKQIVDNKNIAGYQIPDTITINKNGTKTSATPNDFYNYIYQIDKDGLSTYQKELAKEDENSRRNDEVLRAYLKFTGGNYSNLVGMAVNKEQVNKLKLTAKARTAGSVKITKPITSAKGKDVDLGY